jgi:hypothetical protein
MQPVCNNALMPSNEPKNVVKIMMSAFTRANFRYNTESIRCPPVVCILLYALTLPLCSRQFCCHVFICARASRLSISLPLAVRAP